MQHNGDRLITIHVCGQRFQTTLQTLENAWTQKCIDVFASISSERTKPLVRFRDKFWDLLWGREAAPLTGSRFTHRQACIRITLASAAAFLLLRQIQGPATGTSAGLKFVEFNANYCLAVS